MYPFVRMAKELVIHRNAPPLAMGEVHVSRHICWPWDLDFWFELNHGRTLTLYDLGRVPMARRMGLLRVISQNGWGLTVAGVSVRYRHRVRAFQRFEMRSRAIGWDGRFMYLEQSMWNRAGKCVNHALYRTAVSGPDGIVPPQTVMAEMQFDGPTPVLPDWVQAWIEADARRPWPPIRG